MRILLADNRDSFTRNLAHLLAVATGHAPVVVPYAHQQADMIHIRHTPQHAAIKGVCTAHPTALPPTGAGCAASTPASPQGATACHRALHEPWDLIVISPGPGAPEEYPGYGAVLQGTTPVLGICLGLQIINSHFGGTTAPLDGCVHGKTDTALLHGVGSFTVARYHSLHLATLGHAMRPLAHTPQGIIMAARHETLPVMGYQFHPESFLTPDGVFWIRHALDTLELA